MNRFFIQGRMTRDPELKKLDSGVHVCAFTVAVNRPGASRDNPLSDFFDCEIWGAKDGQPGRAGAVAQYFHKGDGIIVMGAMTTRKYTDKDGKNRTAYTVRVDDFEFPAGRRAAEAAPAPGPAESFTAVGNEELPF